jgi:hypothetical protein
MVCRREDFLNSLHWKDGWQQDTMWWEDFLEINQSETRIACGGHVCKRIGTKWAIFIEELPRMLPTKFWFILLSSFRGEYFFRNQPFRHKNGQASMKGPLLTLLISSGSVNKHGCHRQFLLLIGWFLKNLLLWNCLAKWSVTW